MQRIIACPDRLAGRPAGAARLLVTLIVALLVMRPSSVVARQADPAAPPVDGLAGRATTIESLGLTIRLPDVANTTTERIGDYVSVSVSDASSPPRWNLRIQSLGSTLDEPSPAAQIEQHIKGLAKSGATYEVLENTAATHGDVTGHRCYIRRQVPGQGEVISGWFVMPAGDTAGRMFIVLSLVAEPDAFATVRPLIESSFDTLTHRPGAELSLERRSRIESGRMLLESITPEQLRGLLGKESWMRIYRPADPDAGTPEREIGFSHVSVAEGRRAEVGGTSGRDDDPVGLLVRVQGRIVVDEAYLDSIARYWMAWDQSAETWDVRATERLRGEPLRTVAESGIRTEPTLGNPRPVLTVIESIDTTRTRDPYQWELPECYISQALGWVLGRLLPRDSTEPRVFAYYAYLPGKEPELSLRTDHWAPAEDGSGNWTLSTRLSQDIPPFITTYAADGTMVRRLRSDRSVTEPIGLDELRALWKRKGLDMETRSR